MPRSTSAIRRSHLIVAAAAALLCLAVDPRRGRVQQKSRHVQRVLVPLLQAGQGHPRAQPHQILHPRRDDPASPRGHALEVRRYRRPAHRDWWHPCRGRRRVAHQAALPLAPGIRTPRPRCQVRHSAGTRPAAGAAGARLETPCRPEISETSAHPAARRADRAVWRRFPA